MRKLTILLLTLLLAGPASGQGTAELVTQLQDMDPYVRAAAAGQLAYMGEEAASAVPALLDALAKDPEPQVRTEVVAALGQLGLSVPALEDRVVPALTSALEDRSPEVQLRAVVVLQSFPEAAARTAERRFTLVEGLLAGEDEELAARAVDALAELKSLKAIRRLEALLEDPVHAEAAATGIIAAGDFVTRQRLVEHLRKRIAAGEVETSLDKLGSLGAQAAPAVPELRALVADAALDPSVRLQAAALLYELTGDIGGAGPLIAEGAGSQDSQVASRALGLLYRMRPAQAAEHVQVVVAGLKSQELDVINMALTIAANMGRFATPAVPAVAGLLTHQEPLLRANAAEALRSMGPGAAQAAPALKSALSDEHMVVRLQAARTLWDLTGEAGPLLPVVKAALASGDEEAGYIARDLAFTMGPSARDVLGPLLLAEFKKGNVEVLYGLDRMGIPPAEMIPALQAAFQAARETEQRVSIVSVLSSYPAANPAVAELIDRALKDPEFEVRFQAAGLHHMFYRDPTAVLPVVREGLTAEESYQRSTAVMLAAELGTSAADLVPTITAIATGDPDLDTRGYAVSALWQLTRDVEPIKSIFLTNLRQKSMKVFLSVPYDFPLASLAPAMTPADEALLLADLERWTGPLNDDQMYVRDSMFRLEATLLAAAGVEKALPIIEKAGRSPSRSLREAAAEAELLLRRRMES